MGVFRRKLDIAVLSSIQGRAHCNASFIRGDVMGDNTGSKRHECVGTEFWWGTVRSLQHNAILIYDQVLLRLR